MKIDTANWKEFVINRLFDIHTGGDLIMSELEAGTIPVASNSCENNNVAFYTTKINGRHLFNHKTSISIADRGCFYAFIQPHDFYIATRVKALVVKSTISITFNQLCFIATIINQESFKYSYGRNCCANLPHIKIKLPIKYNKDNTPVIDKNRTYCDEGYIPDWQFMEDYIEPLHHKPLTTKNKSTKVPELNIDTWKEFRFGSLIKNIYKSRSINKDDLQEVKEGEIGIRYITRTGEDNGCELIASMSDIERNNIEKGNALTIGDTTATCFYQGEDFITGEHIVVVRANWLNEYNALYVGTILGLEMYKYSYGRAFLIDRIKETIIKLPIILTDKGDPYFDKRCTYSKEGYVPDWQFMEDYIKSLPYGDRL